MCRPPRMKEAFHELCNRGTLASPCPTTQGEGLVEERGLNVPLPPPPALEVQPVAESPPFLQNLPVGLNLVQDICDETPGLPFPTPLLIGTLDKVECLNAMVPLNLEAHC